MAHGVKGKRNRMLSALAAAGIAAIAGAPAALAAATFNISTMEAQSDVLYGGNYWDVWVVAATRTDVSGPNAGIDGVDVTIETTAPMGIDVEKIGGSGVNTTYDVNVDGGTPLNIGADAVLNGGPAPPAFGDVVGGTFVGVGQGPYLCDFANNPEVTQAGASLPGIGVNGQVFANANVETSTTDTYLDAFLPPHFAGQKGSTLSANWVNTGDAVNAGYVKGTEQVTNALVNGNIQSLQVIATMPDPGIEADGPNGPIPIANIVVPTGAGFTASGTITPSGGGAPVAFAANHKSPFTSAEYPAVIFAVSDPYPGIPFFSGNGNPPNEGYIDVPSGLDYLNNMYGGAFGGATGFLPMEAPTHGIVAIAIHVTDSAGPSHSLSTLGDPSLGGIVSDLNKLDINAYAFNDAPPQYAGYVATLSAGEAARGGQPFDILIDPSSDPSNDFLNFNGYYMPLWLFDFSGEIGMQDNITSLQITDIGAIPEPSSAFIVLLGGTTVLCRRRRRCPDRPG
jgi:hypothetical protein